MLVGFLLQVTIVKYIRIYNKFQGYVNVGKMQFWCMNFVIDSIKEKTHGDMHNFMDKNIYDIMT